MTTAIQSVNVCLLGGLSVELTGEDVITCRSLNRVQLRDIREILSDPAEWIEYPTTTWEMEAEEEREAWEPEPQPVEHPAVCRIYARAVVMVMEVREPAA
jgi:hypothetical protein